jgi:hypothetical protein
MSFYTCFDWFKKLKLIIFQCTESENRRHSQGVACRCHQALLDILSIHWELKTKNS